MGRDRSDRLGAPQIAHNISLGHYGVLPAFPLFGGQLKWGVFIARYASFVHDNAAWSYALLNPWRAGTSDIEPVRWYLEHPVDGLGTIIVHVLSAFTFDRLFTYLYDCRPNFLLAGVMWAVIALGALHGARLLYQKFRQPEAIALAILFFSSVGLIAITVPENRFAILPTAILSVLATHFVVIFRRKPKWFLVAAVVAGVLGWQFANVLNAFTPSGGNCSFGVVRALRSMKEIRITPPTCAFRRSGKIRRRGYRAWRRHGGGDGVGVRTPGVTITHGRSQMHITLPIAGPRE